MLNSLISMSTSQQSVFTSTQGKNSWTCWCYLTSQSYEYLLSVVPRRNQCQQPRTWGRMRRDTVVLHSFWIIILELPLKLNWVNPISNGSRFLITQTMTFTMVYFKKMMKKYQESSQNSQQKIQKYHLVAETDPVTSQPSMLTKTPLQQLLSLTPLLPQVQ